MRVWATFATDRYRYLHGVLDVLELIYSKNRGSEDDCWGTPSVKLYACQMAGYILEVLLGVEPQRQIGSRVETSCSSVLGNTHQYLTNEER